jgi:hypothetical protein
VTVRTDLVAELFTRCRADRPDIEWIEGWPGREPPRERVWVFELEGQIEMPLFGASPLIYEDQALMTLHAVSETGGQSRQQVMAKVEAYLTVVMDIVRTNPSLDRVVDATLAITLVALRGPYSGPNATEPGFAGMAALDVRFDTRLT